MNRITLTADLPAGTTVRLCTESPEGPYDVRSTQLLDNPVSSVTFVRVDALLSYTDDIVLIVDPPLSPVDESDPAARLRAALSHADAGAKASALRSTLEYLSTPDGTDMMVRASDVRAHLTKHLSESVPAPPAEGQQVYDIGTNRVMVWYDAERLARLEALADTDRWSLGTRFDAEHGVFIVADCCTPHCTTRVEADGDGLTDFLSVLADHVCDRPAGGGADAA